MGQATRTWWGTGFPWGTIAVNLTGSLLLGLLTGLTLGDSPIPEAWRLPLATGFLGSFTTFSTFSVEIVRQLQAGDIKLAATNLAIQLTVGLAAAAGGLVLGGRLAGA